MRVVESLRRTGHDVIHLSELGLQRLPDGEIFRRAVEERCIVLTFDLDFGKIAAHCQGPWASVILFRLANGRSDHVAERLQVALATAQDALQRGAVVIVEEGRCRVRPLPILRDPPSTEPGR